MNTIYETMAEKRLIAILRKIPENMLMDVLDRLYEGGVRMAEITYDSSGKTSDRETARMIQAAVKHTDGRMYIGAGTVTTVDQLKLTNTAGGRFIISPNTDPAIIDYTKIIGLVSIPGAMTVSEIVNASKAGADYIKVFPAGCLGPAFIKQVLAPISNVKLLAVGGVTKDMIPDYFAAGCAGFGIGSAIANKALCEAGDLDKISENARLYAGMCEKK